VYVCVRKRARVRKRQGETETWGEEKREHETESVIERAKGRDKRGESNGEGARVSKVSKREQERARESARVCV